MKIIFPGCYMELKYCFFLMLLFLFSSCGQKNLDKSKGQNAVILPSPTSDTTMTKKASELGENIRVIFQDSKGNFWFGTDGAGLYRYDGKDLNLFNEKDGLVNNQIYSIQEDAYGSIWVGTALGVSRFDGQRFKTYADLNSSHIKDNSRKEMVISKSDLWFAAGGGAYRWDGKNLNYVFLPLQLESKNISNMIMATRPYAQPALANTVYYTYKDKTGNIWFATQAEGVVRYDGKNFSWLTGDGLGGPAVRAIFEDSKGNYWFGNNGSGLFKYDGKQLTNMTKLFKLENEMFVLSGLTKSGTMARIWAIEEDSSGAIWVGSIDNGLWRFDGKKFINYTTKDGLTSDMIQTIYKDKIGDLWFGTCGGGINKFDGKKFKKFEL